MRNLLNAGVIELIIVAICGLVLILTTLFDGKPSETIIGIFGGYLGASYKNSMANKNTETTTTTTTTTQRDYFKDNPEDNKFSSETTVKKSIYDEE